MTVPLMIFVGVLAVQPADPVGVSPPQGALFHTQFDLGLSPGPMIQGGSQSDTAAVPAQPNNPFPSGGSTSGSTGGGSSTQSSGSSSSHSNAGVAVGAAAAAGVGAIFGHDKLDPNSLDAATRSWLGAHDNSLDTLLLGLIGDDEKRVEAFRKKDQKFTNLFQQIDSRTELLAKLLDVCQGLSSSITTAEPVRETAPTLPPPSGKAKEWFDQHSSALYKILAKAAGTEPIMHGYMQKEGSKASIYCRIDNRTRVLASVATACTSTR